MAEKPINARQRQKYDTSTNWATNNPILLAGEIGVESDTNKIKVGNGTSNWNNLQYIGGEGGSSGTVVDLIISTQEEFEDLLENETWYNARSIVFNGTFDLPDGKYVSIPHTTYEVIGVNNATIVAKGSIGISPNENSNWRFMFYRTFNSPSGSGIIPASGGRQKLRVLNISLNLTNAVVDTGTYNKTVGFYNIANMVNCYVEWIKPRSDNTGYCLCGFHECYNLCNCSVVGYAEVICEGFTVCDNLVNCFSQVNGKSETTAFDNCRRLANCIAEAGPNSTAGRTVYNFDSCYYLVNCPLSDSTSKGNKYITATLDNIPTKTSQLTNDSGFITSSDIPTIPTKTSQLQNDSGFVTSSDIPTKTSQLTNDSNFAVKNSNNTFSGNNSHSGTETFTGPVIVPDVTIS